MKLLKLHNIAAIVMGQSPEAEYVSADKIGLPLLNGPAEFTRWYPIPVQFTTSVKKIAEVNDILFCVRGSTTGRMNIADQEYAIGRGLAALRHRKDPILNSYVKALIEVNLKKLLGGTLGSVFPNITKDNLFDLKCLVHDESEQHKIASFLSSLDDKIEINNKINAELEGMAKLIYDYWFVQFDFHFDFAQGKPADETSNPKDIKPYKSSGGKMVWNEELRREVPEGWEVKKMREVLSIKNGRDHKHLELGTIPVYGSGGIMRYANSYLYNSESILIPRKGSLGNLFYINKPFWCVDTIFYTQMKFPHSCKYLFYTIRNLNISSMNTGTAVPSMTTEVLNNLSLIFPPMECLKKFDEILSPTFQMKNNHSDEIKELSALRDWLLPMLMNGQVQIDDKMEKKYEVKESEVGMAAEPGERYGVDNLE